MARLFVCLILATAMLHLGGCKSGAAREDPILRLSAQEALDQGKEWMEQGKYLRATDYLNHAFEVEPNSAIGREALLLSADAYYSKGATEGFIRAEAKYRDFLNRFPTSERAAYVQFQIANCLARRMRKPDRDQSATRSALEAYQELLILYPTTEYLPQVEEQIRIVEDNLAEHEFAIGRFNLKIKLAAAAIARFERLMEDYPEYGEPDKVLFFLGKAYRLSEDGEKSKETFNRLREEFPQSPYLKKIPQEKVS